MAIFYSKQFHIVLQVGVLKSTHMRAHYELILQTESDEESSMSKKYRLNVLLRIYEVVEYKHNDDTCLDEVCMDTSISRASVVDSMRTLINRGLEEFKFKYNCPLEEFHYSSHRTMTTAEVVSIVRPYMIEGDLQVWQTI